ncbi:MAG: FeoB-associated Cys-rich membrane protein [Clostridia bacterium]|nr:FeoB-associated Cys-rich membrane protein [Clostridia bacterium]
MVNVIVILILVCIVAAIVLYLYRVKKRGEHCVGCPYAKQCASHSGTGCGGCHNTGHQNQ